MGYARAICNVSTRDGSRNRGNKTSITLCHNLNKGDATMYEFKMRLGNKGESINGQSNLRILTPSHEVPPLVLAARTVGARLTALGKRGKKLLYSVTRG